MTISIAAAAGLPATATEPSTVVLSTAELHRLTLYKWRYACEALGYDADQVRRLVFLKWLHLSHRLSH